MYPWTIHLTSLWHRLPICEMRILLPISRLLHRNSVSTPEIMAIHRLELIGEKCYLITIVIISYTEGMMMWEEEISFKLCISASRVGTRKKRRKNIITKIPANWMLSLWITPKLEYFLLKRQKENGKIKKQE